VTTVKPLNPAAAAAAAAVAVVMYDSRGKNSRPFDSPVFSGGNKEPLQSDQHIKILRHVASNAIRHYTIRYDTEIRRLRQKLTGIASLIFHIGP